MKTLIINIDHYEHTIRSKITKYGGKSIRNKMISDRLWNLPYMMIYKNWPYRNL